MKRTLMTALFAAGLTTGAMAQTDMQGEAQMQDQTQMQCSQEANAIWSAVQQSQLEQEQKDQVGQVLQEAQMQEQQGNAEACAQTLEQVKVALGIQQ